AVEAEIVDETINLVPAVYTVQSPRSILNAAGRVDTRVGRSSTLILRYTFDRELQTNGGVGQLALASQAIDTGSLVHTFQAANTVVFSPALVNEARLQYTRTRTAQTPVSKEPAVIVQGAFLDGGNDRGSQDEHRDSFELSDNLAISKKMHYLDVGARVRLGRDSIT